MLFHFVNLREASIVLLMDAHSPNTSILHKNGHTLINEDAVDYFNSKSDVKDLFLISLQRRSPCLGDEFVRRLGVKIHADEASLSYRWRLVVLLLGESGVYLFVLGFEEVIGRLEGTPAVLTADHNKVVTGGYSTVLAVVPHVPKVAVVYVVHGFVGVHAWVLVYGRDLTNNQGKKECHLNRNHPI